MFQGHLSMTLSYKPSRRLFKEAAVLFETPLFFLTDVLKPSNFNDHGFLYQIRNKQYVVPQGNTLLAIWNYIIL
jgi:hypothetical protein